MCPLLRERQDADGQMKELQDQLEAEQYFSVRSLLTVSFHTARTHQKSIGTDDNHGSVLSKLMDISLGDYPYCVGSLVTMLL